MFAWSLSCNSESKVERQAQFRDYIEEVSRAGLTALGIAEIGAPLALFGAWPTALIGAGTLALAGRWPKRHARMIAAGSMLFACVPMSQMGGFALAGVGLILLTGALMVPFRPIHTLAIGIAMEAMYLLQGHPAEEHRFHIAAILLATGLTAVVY